MILRGQKHQNLVAYHRRTIPRETCGECRDPEILMVYQQRINVIKDVWPSSCHVICWKTPSECGKICLSRLSPFLTLRQQRVEDHSSSSHPCRPWSADGHQYARGLQAIAVRSLRLSNQWEISRILKWRYCTI